jgi:hypothetical protein
MKYLIIVAILLVSGCLYNDNQEWLLIEYPNSMDSTIMRFPGLHADTYEECWQQGLSIRHDDNHHGILVCGYQCRFEIGSLVCEYETAVLPCGKIKKR